VVEPGGDGAGATTEPLGGAVNCPDGGIDAPADRQHGGHHWLWQFIPAGAGIAGTTSATAVGGIASPAAALGGGGVCPGGASYPAHGGTQFSVGFAGNFLFATVAILGHHTRYSRTGTDGTLGCDQYGWLGAPVGQALAPITSLGDRDMVPGGGAYWLTHGGTVGNPRQGHVYFGDNFGNPSATILVVALVGARGVV